jgi:carbamate kinase
MARERGWQVGEDPGRGWRRLVPSPRPLRVVEASTIRAVVRAHAIPVAVGGGGVPVIESPTGFRGVEAVIDKDLATGVLARALNASRIFFLTAVDRVAVGFGTPRQRFLDRLGVAEARELLTAGEFPPGTMGPKVEAAVQFVEEGGEAVITSLERLDEAVAGRAGTRVVRETDP